MEGERGATMYNSRLKKDEVSASILLLKQQQNLLREQLSAMSDQLPPDAAERLANIETVLGQISGQLLNERLELTQLRALARTWSMINSSLDLNTVLTRAMEQVIELSGAERGYLLWKKPNSDEYHIASSVERDGDDKTFQISNTIVNKVMTSGEPVLSADASGDEALGAAASIMHYAIRSVLCVPLRNKEGGVFGVVYVANRFKVGQFSEREMRLLNAFANQASIAIDNARVFTRVRTELQKTTEELRQLRIDINRTEVQSKVADITETDYFKHLQSTVRKLRIQTAEMNGDDEPTTSG